MLDAVCQVLWHFDIGVADSSGAFKEAQAAT